ncbi:MAG: MarR family transcriptional regulator [Lachnospiraceae bacterium]|nr:MarR family transcriptional regulator [Lachnospiraceae bacterium]
MDDIYTAVYEKLATLQWLMKRRQMFSQAQSGPFADPTRGQGRILAMLKIQPEIKTRELAYLLGIRQQSLNELLNKLEKSGHVERKPSEKDKRVMVVHLTEKGKMIPQPETDYQEILDCLSPEELQQFGEYLDRIIAAFGIQEAGGREEDHITDWMDQARERMGGEQFEQLMSMRERAFGSFGRGRSPADIPGAERFSPDYDGYIPDRGGFGAYGGRPDSQISHNRQRDI